MSYDERQVFVKLGRISMRRVSRVTIGQPDGVLIELDMGPSFEIPESDFARVAVRYLEAVGVVKVGPFVVGGAS